MQDLDLFCVSTKAGRILVSLIVTGLAARFLPESLHVLTTLGSIVAYFSAGILAAQHMRIWEKAQVIRRRRD